MINKKMSKTLIIIIISLCLIFLFAIGIAVLVFVSGLTNQGASTGPNVNSAPVEVIAKPATAYGVKMQDKCLAKFNDFLKTSGQDYSKCLVGFSSNGEYCGGFDPTTQALSDASVIVILDASGSMAEKIGPDTKMDIAKKAVSDFLNEMPASVNTGLIVYGQEGSGSEADKNLSCQGIQEVVKLGKNNGNNIISAMDSFSPKGWTPIAGSLEFAKNIFSEKDKTDKNYLILVSDGVEDCNGDPIAAARDIKLEFPNIDLGVIGFATDSQAHDSLTKIASIGGGSYMSANSSSDISKAFNMQLLAIEKDCINVTLFETDLIYKTNDLNNLNCWLAAYDKESTSFSVAEKQKPIDSECNSEMSAALIAREQQYWYQKQDLEGKNDAIYNKMVTDFNSQLKALGK